MKVYLRICWQIYLPVVNRMWLHFEALVQNTQKLGLRRATREINTNPNPFWKYAQSKMKAIPRVADLEKEENVD